MTDFKLQDIDNKLADKEISFLNRHPILAPVVSTVFAASAGACLGKIMPLKQDTFVKYISYEKSDEYIGLAQKCENYISLLNSNDKEKFEQEIKDFVKKNTTETYAEKNLEKSLIEIGKSALLKVRILLGEEAFNRLCSDFQEGKMLKDGKEILAFEAINRKNKYRKKLLDEYLDFIKNHKSEKLPEIYERAIKQLRKANAKNLAIIFGISTAIITEIYSYIKNAAKIKNYMQVQNTK